jgi:hypothetical protein
MILYIFMMALLPAIVFLAVAGSGIFLPPSKDENETIRHAIDHASLILAFNGLLFGLGTYFYLSRGASILFWFAAICAALLTVLEGVIVMYIARRRL